MQLESGGRHAFHVREPDRARLRLCRPAVLGATARLRHVVWKQTHAALKPTSGLVSSTDVCPGTSGRADGPRPESADARCGPFRAGSRPGLRALLALARAVVGDPVAQPRPRAPARTGLRLLRVPSRPRLGTGPLPPPTRFCSPGRRLGSPAFEKRVGRWGAADESQHCPPGLGPPSGEWQGGRRARSGQAGRRGEALHARRPAGSLPPRGPGGRWWARFRVSHPHTARREPSASDV